MKHILIITMLSFVQLFSINAISQSNKKALTIFHLTGDFYIYTTYKLLDGEPYPSNSMYLVTTAGIVLFDTPWDSTQFQPLLDSLEKRHHQKVVLCIPGHFHADRTAGLEFLNQKGIKTFSSKMTYDLCKIHNEKQSEFYFTNDTSFTVGNHQFQTYYPGAGHAPDNIVIWFPAEKILYGGCFVKSTETTSLGNIADANLSEWPLSIERIIKKFGHPNYVIPGHLSWKNNKGLEHTLKLLQENNNK